MRRNWSTISSGARRAGFQSEDESESSIALTMKRYWSSVCIRRFFDNEGLSEELRDEKTVWKERYRSIENFETHLHLNGTHVVKIFLHLSRKSSASVSSNASTSPTKIGSSVLADIHERKYWSKYVEAFEECLNATSTQASPWFVVPADDKENARLIVSRIVMDALKDLKMSYPKTTSKRKAELQAIRKLLAK